MDNYSKMRKAVRIFWDQETAVAKFLIFLLCEILIAVIIILFLIFAPNNCYATPTLKTSVGLGVGVAFPDGEPTAMTPSIKLDVGMVLKMSKNWGWYTAIGASVPTTIFHPAIRLVTGPGVRLSKSWSLGASILYQSHPSYGDKDWSHLLAVSVTPSVQITKEISLVFVIGPGVMLGNDDPVWSIAFQPKISFRLPDFW